MGFSEGHGGGGVGAVSSVETWIGGGVRPRLSPLRSGGVTVKPAPCRVRPRKPHRATRGAQLKPVDTRSGAAASGQRS